VTKRSRAKSQKELKEREKHKRDEQERGQPEGDSTIKAAQPWGGVRKIGSGETNAETNLVVQI